MLSLLNNIGIRARPVSPHNSSSSATNQIIATIKDILGLIVTAGEMKLLENINLVNVAPVRQRKGGCDVPGESPATPVLSPVLTAILRARPDHHLLDAAQL